MSHRSLTPPRLRTAFAALIAGLALVFTSGAASGLAHAPTAPTVPTAPAAADEVHGLKGEYFRMSEPGARDFAELGGIVLEENIDLDGLVSTFERLTGQTEHTTARWTGELEAPEDGDYTFYLTGDNGFRFYLDDELVVDHWEPDWDNEQTSEPITLRAGERHDVRIEYFQDLGGAHMFMRWASETIDKQIVPTTVFYPPADFEIFPLDLTVAEDGLTVLAEFEGLVEGIEDLAGHVEVEADTIAIPVTAAAASPENPRAVVLTLAAPIQAGQSARLYYDGEGSLAVDGEDVPLIARNATNLSEHRLLTEWGEELDHDDPLPEYPRPQAVRDRWRNLNGQWEFAGATAEAEPEFGATLPERITVPFPVESQLSGLERHEDHMFYRTGFEVPADWRIGEGERLVLHFGAVDHEARVWVNGELVTEHSGGFTAFDVDVTDALNDSGEQELIVGVTDVTGENQPLGKQSRNPSGIVYTSSSGIWQTVWLELVPEAHLEDFTLTPDIEAGELAIVASAPAAGPDAVVEAVAYDADGAEVGRTSGAPGEELALPVPNARLWSPSDPYLYDLELTLTDGEASDVVDSYFGMRSVEVTDVGGVPKLVLNGEPIFSLAMLDQGYWPDGLMTAPSDEALAYDLEVQKDLGFNAVRKHIKTEPMRWYYHADRLGLLVWQDFVNVTVTDDSGKEAFLTEGERMMDQLHNSPSIIGWVVFNEGWGEWDREATGRIADDVGERDPSRVINAHSGVNCCDSKGDSGAGDIIDHHDYTNTEPPFPDETRAAMDGEHGGFTLPTPGHLWPGAPAAIYSGVDDKAALTAKYVDNTRRYYLDRARSDLSGSVYTQITDLENEVNGLMTYDRKVLKVDPGPVREINEQVIAAGASAGATPPGAASWPLDEGEGDVAHDAGEFGLDLTLDGATWTEGVRGGALAFDGDGQYAGTGRPVVDTAGSYSVAAWVLLDELPGNYATAISQDGSAVENPFYLQYGQGAFAFSTPGGNRARLETTPETGRWYHLVGVHDAEAEEISLYVDGELAQTSAAAEPVGSAGEFTIGRGAYNHEPGDWWSGSIDDVHVLPYAADAEDVAGLYAGPEEPGDGDDEGDADGSDDTDGADGSDGSDGSDGADGSDGSDGSGGADVDGADGSDGADGQDGSEGSDDDGSDGAGGQDGADGSDGPDGTDAAGGQPTDDSGSTQADGSETPGDRLPVTGSEAAAVGLLAIVLAAAGLVLRRRATA